MVSRPSSRGRGPARYHDRHHRPARDRQRPRSRGHPLHARMRQGLAAVMFVMAPPACGDRDGDLRRLARRRRPRLLPGSPWVLGLPSDELPGVVAARRRWSPAARLRGKVIDATPRPDRAGARGLRAAGIGSDHESTTVEEAREKLRLGMTVFLREATNATTCAPSRPWSRPSTTPPLPVHDDRQPRLLDQGTSITWCGWRSLGRRAAGGAALATFNTASTSACTTAARSPGRRADLIVFADSPSRARTWSSGAAACGRTGPAAVEGRARTPPARHDERRTGTRSTSRAGRGDRLRVIGAIANQLVTSHLVDRRGSWTAAPWRPRSRPAQMAVIEPTRLRAVGKVRARARSRPARSPPRWRTTTTTSR